MTAVTPWRSGGAQPAPSVPRPPSRMALWRDRRPLKRWRYVGAYTPELSLCAARVSLGGAPQSFWAVWDRRGGALRERTLFLPARVTVDGAVRFAGKGVRCDLELVPEGDVVEVVSPHGASYIWTRKQPARVRGAVELDGRRLEVDGPALIDESAGYHARVTAWSWSAGAGTTADGRAVVWNLVAGVHDDPRASEQAVWLDGRAVEPGPVRFEGLDAVHGADGEVLRFSAEAQRARHDRLLLLESAYCQPFGQFSGTLPGGVELAAGAGVMERHDVRW